MARPAFRLNVFGSFSAFGSDDAEVRFPTRSVAGITAFISLRSGQWVRREELAATFWPETATARGALRTALHRARDSFGGISPFEYDEDRVRLDESAVETDLEVSRRAHKRYLLCTSQSEAIDLLMEEWQIVNHPLLEGWNDEWIEPLRLQWITHMAELGCELAGMLEAAGDPRSALPIAQRILAEIPYHADALELAMRLEFEQNGPRPALEHLRLARQHIADAPEIGLPKSVIALGRSIQEDSYRVVPPPESFADRSSVALLGHLFESNLKSNRGEALATLAAEAYAPICMCHPETTFTLLKKALELTEGTSPERIAVVAAAITFAEFTNDFRTGYELTDFLIREFPPESNLHNGALSMKGLFYMGEGRSEDARQLLQRGIDGCNEPTRRAVAIAMMATLDYSEMRFETAEEGLRSAFGALGTSDRTDKGRNQAGILLSLTYVQLAQCKWREAIDLAEEASECAKKFSAPVRVMSFAPSGLAQVMSGNAKRGLQMIAEGIGETHKERMSRAHRQALDCAAIAFHNVGRHKVSGGVLEATADLRDRYSHPRNQAEVSLIRSITGIDPATPTKSDRINPLRLQSTGSLSQWVADELRSSRV